MRERKRNLALLAAAAGLLACLLPPLWGGRTAWVFAGGGEQAELPVMMYHSLVEQEGLAAQYVCPIGRVESDLAWLAEQGYESVTLTQLLAYAEGRGELPEKPVLITLDDGYRNNLTLLPPLLEKYDFHAVIGLVGEYADVYTACGDDGSRHACMSWEDAALAAQSPRLELAAHSYYFHHLAGRKGAARRRGESLSDWRAALLSDCQALRQAMEEACGQAPLAYAYPFGQISPGADEILREAGFRITLSCAEKINLLTRGDPGCLYSLGRANRDGRWSTGQYMERLLGKK